MTSIARAFTTRDIERFEVKVDRSGGPDACHLWTTSKRGAYGMFRINGRHLGAHRIAYEMAGGAVPDGLFVCHRCDVQLCVNPAHLFLGTQAENMSDMVAKGRARKAHGERHCCAKLTDETVAGLKADLAAGMTQRRAAVKYGVSQKAVHKVNTRQSWKHLA